MTTETFPLRRIVTSVDDRGRSFIGIDGPPAEAVEFGFGAGLFEIWTDVVGPLDRKSSADAGAGRIDSVRRRAERR